MKTTRRNFIRNVGGTTAAMATCTGLVFAGSADTPALSPAVSESLSVPSADITWKFLRANFKMNWTLEPSADSWDKEGDASNSDDIRGIYKSNGYTLAIDIDNQGKAAVVCFKITRSNRQRFKVHAYEITCNTSQSGVYKIFTPGMMQQQHYKIDLPFEFTTVSRAENDFPAIWMQQTNGINTLTLGLLDQVGRAVLRGTSYLGNESGEAPGIANKYASVSLERTMTTAGNINSFEDGLYINADAAISWFDALTRYSDKADEFRGYTPVTLFYLDPRLEKVHSYLLEAWERLFTHYGVDGLWYDFLEIPEDPDMPAQGAVVLYDDIREAFTKLMQALFKKARTIIPDAVVVLRRGSANLNAKMYCTHVWPMDVPQDYNMNHRDVVFMKTYGKGVLTHACCTTWTISETALNVAGIPSFFVLLKESPPEHNRIISAWLSFYEKHKRDLTEGQMKPLLPTPPSAVLYTKGENQVFIGFFEAVTGVVDMDPVDSVTIINAYNNHTATRLEGLRGKWRVTVFDYTWTQINEHSIQADTQNGVMLNVKTELGCHIIVLKKDNTTR